jgi:hypothetical protein
MRHIDPNPMVNEMKPDMHEDLQVAAFVGIILIIAIVLGMLFFLGYVEGGLM